VLVSTDKGKGSGFIVKLNGKIYVITNTHVIFGAADVTLRMLDGTILRWSQIEICPTVDLARFTIKDSEPPSLDLNNNEVDIGTLINVAGNSQGSDTATLLTGKVLAVGPEKIEVDAGFVAGNSGSPILDSKGKVLGVATYVTCTSSRFDWALGGTRFDGIRRFGICINERLDWNLSNLEILRTQENSLKDINEMINDLCFLVIYFNWSRSTDRQYGPRAIEVVEKYDLESESKRYFDKNFPILLSKYCMTRNKWMELYKWYRTAENSNAIDIGRANAYREKYKQTYSASKIRSDYQNAQKESADLLKKLCDYPLNILKSIRWSSLSIKENADSAASSLDLIKRRVGDIRLSGRCNTFYHLPSDAYP